MNAVITLLPQFWTCSEKKKGAKIQSVLPGEFLSHFARLKDPILQARSSLSYASVVFRAKHAVLRCTSLPGYPMRRKWSVFSSPACPRASTNLVAVAKDEQLLRIIMPGWFLLKLMIKLQSVLALYPSPLPQGYFCLRCTCLKYRLSLFTSAPNVFSRGNKCGFLRNIPNAFFNLPTILFFSLPSFYTGHPDWMKYFFLRFQK